MSNILSRRSFLFFSLFTICFDIRKTTPDLIKKNKIDNQIELEYVELVEHLNDKSKTISTVFVYGLKHLNINKVNDLSVNLYINKQYFHIDIDIESELSENRMKLTSKNLINIIKNNTYSVSGLKNNDHVFLEITKEKEVLNSIKINNLF